MDELIEDALDNPLLKGITFSGGDPLERAAEFAYMAKAFKKAWSLIGKGLKNKRLKKAVVEIAPVIARVAPRARAWWRGKTMAAIGATGVGKNSLFNRLRGEPIPDPAGELIDDRAAPVLDPGLDLAGAEHRGVAGAPGVEVSVDEELVRLGGVEDGIGDDIAPHHRVAALRAEDDTDVDAEPISCTVPADDVFVMAGGTPPFEILEKSGVSFDSTLLDKPDLGEQGTGLVRALGTAFVLARRSTISAGEPQNDRE